MTAERRPAASRRSESERFQIDSSDRRDGPECLSVFRMDCVLKYPSPSRFRKRFPSPFQSGRAMTDADCVLNWYANSLRFRVCRFASTTTLSERHCAEGSEETKAAAAVPILRCILRSCSSCKHPLRQYARITAVPP